MPTLKRYVVVRDKYTRGGSGGLDVSLESAESLEALCQQLIGWEDDERPKDVVQYMRESNGDGCDFYIIKEILSEDTLSKDLLE